MVPYLITLLALIVSSIGILFFARRRIILSYDIAHKIRPSKLVVILLSLLPVVLIGFFMGFRYDVGTDYDSYIRIFYELGSGNPRVYERFEPLFVHVNLLVHALGLDAQYILLLFYVVTLGFLFIAVFKEPFTSYTMYFLAIIVLFGFGPLFGISNTVRQGFVSALGLLVVSLVYKKRILGGALSAVIGFGFHKSSLVMLAFSFIPKKNMGPLLWGVVTIICFLFYLFLSHRLTEILLPISMFFGLFEGYLLEGREHREMSGLGIRVYFEVFLFLGLAFFAHKLPSRAIFFFNISFIGILLRMAFQDYAILVRASSYFYVFTVLALPWFAAVFRGIQLQAYVLFIFLYSLLLYMRNITSSQFSPYQFAPFIGY